MPAAEHGQRLTQQQFRAKQEAERIVDDARVLVRQMKLDAHAQIADQQLEFHTQARASALEALVVEAVVLQKRRQQLDQANTTRMVEMARLMAERLLGETLRLQPETIASLASQTLKEATGARHVVLFAHPQDAAILSGKWAKEPSILDSLEVRSEPDLRRGHLRVETELGLMDADIGSQLDRVAEQLRRLLTSDSNK